MIELLLISAVNIILLAGVIVLLSKILPRADKYPLGLPKGSVRALLTLLVLSPLPIVLIKGVNIPEGYFTIAGIVLTFYFTIRTIDKNE
jgi:hypothetical protein